MFRVSLMRAALLAVLASVVVFAAGCTSKVSGTLNPNQRPSVDLTSAPTQSTDRYFYAYRLDWSGYDPDGKVDYFLYAIDPPGPAAVAAGAETTWVKTTKNEQILFFKASRPDSGSVSRPTASDFHVFVIKAIDNGGLASAPKSRAFFSYTVAPSVQITNPTPSSLLQALVTPSVRISWQGTDPDGQFSQKPVKYKYRLIKQGDPEFDLTLAVSNPDSLRRFYAARAWAGWDSTSAETTQVQFTNLTPNSQFLFVVIGFDEAGAYSPIFTLNSNMLQFSVGYAGTLGPQFTVFNEFFFYQYSSGGNTPNDPLSWIKIEVPTDRKVTFNWFAAPPAGSTIEYYRWMVDGDVGDETPRTNESTDWVHWSQKSPGTGACTIGPFDPGRPHFLYIQAKDNNDLVSLATIYFQPVRPTFAKSLLVVDDTRLEVDKYQSNLICQRRYTTTWPARAELDTFLFARGNVPWRCTITGANQPTLSTGAKTKPGVFAGYDFDTLGTRLGYELASSGVPLSKLGQYKNIIWMVDSYGAQKTNSPTAVIDPATTLRWMCTPGRSSTLAAFIYAGGRVWLLGGGAAYASLFEFNAKGSKDNDKLYSLSQTVFSNSSNELIPGRIMYDGAHWQSEMIVQLTPTSILKSPAAVGGWTNPGNGYVGTLTAPDYSLLPAQMRIRQLSLGDSLPPTRGTSQSSTFFLDPNATSLDVEYLDQPNRIIEDINPDPLVENQRSTLDTLYELAPNTTMATDKTGQRPVVMTYYHGVTAPQFVFSGFNLWTYSRRDVISLVDFVLQQIWGLSRSPVSRGVPADGALPAPGLGHSRPVTPAQRSLNARLPLGRTRE